MIARGYRAATLIDFETAFAETPASKAGYKLPIISNELNMSQTLVESDTITGSRNNAATGLGRIAVDGNIVVPADYRAMGYWLKAQFGAPTTKAADTLFQHVFKVVDDQPSIIIEKAFPDIGKYFHYKGCKLNTAKWEFGDDKQMTVEMALMGAAREIATETYNASAKSILPNPISQNHTYVKLCGSESHIVKSGDFTLDGSLDGDQYVVGGGGVRGAIPEELFGASGTIEALFENTDTMELAQAGTTTSLEIGFKAGDGKTSLSFLFPEVQIQPHDASISGPGGVSISFDWRAFYEKDSNASLVVATLVNDVESY